LTATGPRESRIPISASGPAIHLVEWGRPDGFPVVFLHGGAHDASHWAAVCRRLPDTLRCIVPDQRGHGHSDPAPDGDYSCAAQVSDLVGLLDALAVERCALVGHSMGGLNALRFAGTWPERTAALVLIDVGTDTRRAGREAIERSRGRGGPQSVSLNFDARLLDFVPTYGGDEGERRRLLVASKAPLLVLRGARSRILSADAAEACARQGEGTAVDIPDAGHNAAQQNPESVARALARFLGPLAATRR
jgi:pimeloyl-ACP methyl ester carboxylesterase